MKSSYEIEHPKGGSYEIPALHYACLEKDSALFAEALPLTPELKRKAPVVEGKNALAVSFGSGFDEGAQALLALDGPCCQMRKHCLCLQIALENKQFKMIANLRDFITSESDFIRVQPQIFAPEFRNEARVALNLSAFKSAYYLNKGLRQDSLPSFSWLTRELEIFPKVNINEVGDDGLTPLQFYVSSLEPSPSFVELLLRRGANPNQVDAQNRTCLDLIRANKSCSSSNRRSMEKDLQSYEGRANQGFWSRFFRRP